MVSRVARDVMLLPLRLRRHLEGGPQLQLPVVSEIFHVLSLEALECQYVWQLAFELLVEVRDAGTAATPSD